jgi:hypothetical protein
MKSAGEITASVTYDMVAALMILEVRTPFPKAAGVALGEVWPARLLQGAEISEVAT